MVGNNMKSLEISEQEVNSAPRMLHVSALFGYTERFRRLDTVHSTPVYGVSPSYPNHGHFHEVYLQCSLIWAVFI